MTCAHLIRESEARSYRTYWNCSKENQASAGLARRLGYQAEKEFRFVVYSPRDQYCSTERMPHDRFAHEITAMFAIQQQQSALVEKDLSVRVHEYPHCGLILDRDQNAAINILRLGLQNLRL